MNRMSFNEVPLSLTNKDYSYFGSRILIVDNKNNFQDRIIDYLLEKGDDVHSIYLFGSRADQSNFTDDSDWDIALLSGHHAGFKSLDIWELQLGISAELDIKVDLVDFRNVSTLLQFEILKSGVLLWSQNENAAREVEAQLLGEYQDFHASQRAIMSSIHQRRKVYG